MAGALKLLYFLLCVCSHALTSLGNNSSTDVLALLSFKSKLSPGQSGGMLASWNMSSPYCRWPGVACGSRHPDRVVALLLSSFNLSGPISPFLGNLSFLRMLDLRDNHLVGQIPPELGRLRRLQWLNLSSNSLQGSIPAAIGGCTNLKMLEISNNMLQGEIPTEIGALKDLTGIGLQENDLSGEIPHSLTRLQSLEQLLLYENRLSGAMPSSLGNLTNLLVLALSENMISGAIPSSVGMLSSLSELILGANNLSGLIPDSLWNISSLKYISFRQNMLSGTIPPNAFRNVPLLQVLLMDTNQFHGLIPTSISNASDMAALQLATNFFSGIIPQEVGSLRSLSFLQLSNNSFHAREPKEWGFLTALANCSELRLLGLAGNKFWGILPDSVSNLSTSLTALTFEFNRLSGSIPKDIGNLINLDSLLLDRNLFTGPLPSSLFSLKNLVIFYIYGNNITGSIPLAIGNLTALSYLLLYGNAFSGAIPNTLGNLTNLSQLSLSNNYLSGPIPNAIFNIRTLSTILDLAYNDLEGSLPQEIGNLKNLIEFYAQSNKLSGEIPTRIGECQLLQFMDLKSNTLHGSIPLTLSEMRSLEMIDLSINNLSGQIPKSLGNLTMLYYLNLSFNNFVGEVPDFGVFANLTAISIQGNDKLCGGIRDLNLPACSLPLSKRKHKFLVIPIAVSLVTTLVVFVLICMYIWHNKRKAKIPSTYFMQGHPLISYSQLVRATDGFSVTNLLGSGSFGSVYKGELNDQEGEGTSAVAVKVLKLQTSRALKSFASECETLRHVRHRNLVKIITICSSIDARGNDFRAIVYDFMPNGSLESWLHPDEIDQAEQRYLNLLERVIILLDVAYALDYLHCQVHEPVVHCDIKSSNVLLDADMVAHLGDFGLAKILIQGGSMPQQSTSSMGFRGTIGYVAPEYGAGNMLSNLGDIYSYGILVLETVTGTRPTDSRFTQGLSLREYVDLALQNRTMDAVDTRLSLDLENELNAMGDSSYKRKMDCLVSLLRLGMSCTQELPSSRMPTEGIVRELLAIKDSLLRTEHEGRQ